MGETLKEKTVSALFWNFVDRFGQQIIYVISGIILVRLLTPEDYGLVGLLAIFIAISSIFTDSGFGHSLVRNQDVRDDDYSTIFLFNIFIGVTLYVILFFCAPLIARFYNQPQLTLLSRIIFLCIPINALCVIQNIVLMKQILFNISAKIGLTALSISGVVSITMAFLGFGVWALIAQTLLFSVFRTILFWTWGKWKVSFVFSIESLKQNFLFSSNILVVSSLNIFLNNIYSATIGKFFPLKQVGYYTQANKFAELSTMITSVVQSSMYPVLAKIKDDDERLKRACRKTIRTLSFFLFPVSFGLICTAKPLFIIFLTEKWAYSIPYFQLLCFAGIFLPFLTLNTNFLYIKGYANVVLRLEIIKFVMIIASLAISIRIGIMACIISLIIVRIIFFIILAFIGGRKINYSIFEQCHDMAPYIAISLAMAGLIYSLIFITDNLYILITLQIVVGIIFYIIANKILGSKIFEEVKYMITNKLRE